MNARTAARALLIAAALTSAPQAIANAAPVFDVEAYESCTATTVPGPDQDFDGMVAGCCAQSAGIPTPTSYGMGCVAQVDHPTDDYRPTIILPTRIAPDGLNPQDSAEPLP